MVVDDEHGSRARAIRHELTWLVPGEPLPEPPPPRQGRPSPPSSGLRPASQSRNPPNDRSHSSGLASARVSSPSSHTYTSWDSGRRSGVLRPDKAADRVRESTEDLDASGQGHGRRDARTPAVVE